MHFKLSRNVIHFYKTQPVLLQLRKLRLKNVPEIKKCTDYNFNLKLKSNLKKISTLRHNNTFKLFVVFFEKSMQEI